jgi:hypothetical protein
MIALGQLRAGWAEHPACSGRAAAAPCEDSTARTHRRLVPDLLPQRLIDGHAADLRPGVEPKSFQVRAHVTHVTSIGEPRAIKLSSCWL